MRKFFVAGAFIAGAAAVIAAQSAPAQNPPDQRPEGVLVAPQAPREIIRRSVDLVTNTVIVRDDKGQFVANLGKNDFEVLEDGVPQDLITFVLTHGGRVLNDVGAPPPPVQEGILLPPPRPTNDASGRIFLIFVDDLHMDFRNTGRIKDLFKKISKELVHDGDMFGIVSSGPSSIAIDMTYDRKRLDEAILKISGAGLKPQEIIETPDGSQGPPEVRYRAHVAFSTAYEVLEKMEQVHNRRKAFIYVSNGYDFDPFAKSRAKESNQRFSAMSGSSSSGASGSDSSQVPETNPFSKTGNEFAAADLASELSELTRRANRSNTVMYTIDPRGLVGGPDLDDTKLDQMDWQDHIRETQSSLRVIADLTGGFAVVNNNDFDKALKRIDAETSDYYVLGYYSTNPDPLKKRRNIEIRVKTKTPVKYALNYKPSYTLKPPPAVKSSSK
ncbi:MAG: VWA domain-containing protein [Vicinamibacterales bacterium]